MNSHTNSDVHAMNSSKSEDNETVAQYKEDPESTADHLIIEESHDKDTKDPEDGIQERKLLSIPDGGWGWVVVFAAFVILACVNGLTYSYGLLHEKFTGYLIASQSKIAFIGGLFFATPLLIAPIISALVDRLGCRILTILGGVVSTAGLLLAAVSNSVAALSITFGILSSLATGVFNVTAFVSVAFWFDKRRNLALALASSGIGFGMSIFPFITYKLLETEFRKRTMIILAGILLNTCACGALMRNPDWFIIKQKKDRMLAKSRPTELSSASSQQPSKCLNQLLTTVTMDRHYLKDLPLYKNIMYRGAILSNTRYQLKASSHPDMYRNSAWSIDSKSERELRWYDRVWMTLSETYPFEMLSELHFLMLAVCSLILSMCAVSPHFFIKLFMSAHGTQGGAQIISIIGVASGIGIVFFGWSTDKPWVNVTKAYAVSSFVCGASIALYPVYIASYWALAINSVVFGLSFASSYSYTPVILMNLMPIESFNSAYGFILLSQGLGHLIGPPIGGKLFDLTGNWNLTFYLGGSTLMLSSLFVGVIVFTKNFRICGSARLPEGPAMAETTAAV